MILSAYLYHTQDELPVPERWLNFGGFDPCAVNARITFDRYAKTIGENYGDYMYIVDLISSTIDTCHEIVPRDESLKTMAYRERLRALPREEGLLLEAARSILSAAGGDILRMATNAIYESTTRNCSSYRVYLTDFPIGDEHHFTQSMQNVLHFLMRDTAADGPAEAALGGEPFWACMSVEDAVRRSVELAYVPGPTSTTGGGHVTQGMIDSAERAMLKAHLRDHPAIGPLLDVVREIINY